ncbi:hypothetical protein SASPL_138114 [Salvia splendens]|uniref:BED-type domain-containing protein n=1 Tax=Salvia splendens TaxID=180675 RepID=A0A8X8ZE31_SALSN|nr:hypothetical protein SASPL_138114 [Salvia splendens]
MVSPASKKRKHVMRSDIWKKFDKVVEDSIQKGKCKLCGNTICADPKNNGTSAMWKHHASCLKKNEAEKNKTPLSQDELWQDIQERGRYALCRMIVLDEQPFRLVEREGFRLFCRDMLPSFNIPSRYTVRSDCVKMFLEERELLKVVFSRPSMSRVSITTDCWTGVNNTSFICVTSHFIDKEWRLHKKIISFFDITSHKGDDIAKVLIKAHTNWGIQRLFCCTMDNAKNNGVAIKEMKSTFNARGMLVANGQYFHQRCVAHILNLVVEDGMKKIGMAVVRVREAMKWIKGSSTRSKAFKDIAKVRKVDTKKFLCQDVPTRWNSTYLMLEAALPYEPVMKLFSNVTPQFGRDLRNLKHNDLTVGVPGEEDWIEVRKMCSFLHSFYAMTRLVSGTTYATSYSFLMEMCDIFLIIKRLEDDEDAEIRYMAKKMMEKLGKYWLEGHELNPNMNKILYIAAMLDPRQKMKHVQHCLKTLYGDARANELAEELRKSVFDLFELYKREFTPVAAKTQPQTASASQMSNRSTNLRLLGRSSCNILCVASEDDDDDDEDGSSELTRYFAEKQFKANEDDFGILMWWKTYGISYPILSEMAKDILAIPIPSVASESAISMGGMSNSSSADLMEEEGEPIPFLKKQYYETVEALHKDGKVTWPLDGAELGELERTHSSDHDES